MSSETPAMLPLGSHIAPHLRLRSVLGHGGMAIVYEAHHARLRADVAVKVCTVSGERAEEAARDLVQEARLCARLDSPYFPRVYDIAELEDGRPYFVMEKVTGPNLEQYLGRGPLPLHSAIRITLELLGAAHVAHQRGIVHRDLKPANVLLQVADGRVRNLRVMDFGVAHLYAPRPEDRDLAAEGTGITKLYGTPGHMAPEQVRGRPVDGRTDIYAIGVLLYEMLTARSPFDWRPEDEADPNAFLLRAAATRLPDPRKFVPECPAAVVDWIATATALDPRHRFDSARAAAQALRDWQTSTAREHPAVTRLAHSYPPSALSRRRSAAGALAAAAAAGMAWWGASTLEVGSAMAVSPSLELADAPSRAGEQQALAEPTHAQTLGSGHPPTAARPRDAAGGPAEVLAQPPEPSSPTPPTAADDATGRDQDEQAQAGGHHRGGDASPHASAQQILDEATRVLAARVSVWRDALSGAEAAAARTAGLGATSSVASPERDDALPSNPY